MTSLKKELNDLIKGRVYVPIEDIYRFTLEAGYKISNSERRLRRSESPDVEPEWGTSKRGTRFIKGYWWRERKKNIPNEQVHFRPDFLQGKKLEKSKLI